MQQSVFLSEDRVVLNSLINQRFKQVDFLAEGDDVFFHTLTDHIETSLPQAFLFCRALFHQFITRYNLGQLNGIELR